MSEHLKTSVRVTGQEQVDDFRALCLLDGRKPWQLAADFVLDGIRRAREDPTTMEYLMRMRAVIGAERAEAEARAAGNVIPMWGRRR